MKILILFKKWEGGVGTVIKYFIKWMERRGHELKVISREDDLKIYSLAKSIFPIRKKVQQLMEEENFDVIFTNDWSSAFPLLFPFPLFKERHFCLFHGVQPFGVARLLQIMVGNLMGKRLLVDLSKKYFPKAIVHYERVDTEIFKPDTKIKTIKNSVGFSSWKTDAYHYNETKQAVEKLGMKFMVAENIPKDKMPDYYKKLEYFVSLPPSYAGFGLVNIEAMASGVPKIIGSNFGGGNLLPITKIEDFGKDIASAIKNAKKKDYRKWILDHGFSWESGSEILERIFMKGIGKLSN